MYIKFRVQVQPITRQESPEWEYMYSCNLLLTLALGGCSRARPGRFA